VPDGGEARIELTAVEGGDRSGFAVTDVDPSTATAPDAASQAQLASLRKLLDDVAKATDITPPRASGCRASSPSRSSVSSHRRSSRSRGAISW